MKRKARRQLVEVARVSVCPRGGGAGRTDRRGKKAKMVPVRLETIPDEDEREKTDRRIDLDSMLEFMAAHHREMVRVMRLKAHGYTNAEIAKIEGVEERHVYRLQSEARSFLASHFPGMFPI